MKLTDMKIGVRLGAGFGVVLLLMAVLVLTGLLRLDKIGALSDAIIERDWAKADAIATVRSTTRSNAALVLELFIHEDPARANAIHGEIDANKATISVEPTGTLKAESNFVIKAEDYKIDIPSVVRKQIAEEIQVKVRIDYQKM